MIRSLHSPFFHVYLFYMPTFITPMIYAQSTLTSTIFVDVADVPAAESTDEPVVSIDESIDEGAVDPTARSAFNGAITEYFWFRGGMGSARTSWSWTGIYNIDLDIGDVGDILPLVPRGLGWSQPVCPRRPRYFFMDSSPQGGIDHLLASGVGFSTTPLRSETLSTMILDDLSDVGVALRLCHSLMLEQFVTSRPALERCVERYHSVVGLQRRERSGTVASCNHGGQFGPQDPGETDSDSSTSTSDSMPGLI